MTRKGEQLTCLSQEGRNYVDQVVQAKCGGRYLELSGSIRHRLAVETGVSFAQIQNYLRNKHQSIRNAHSSPTAPLSASLPEVPAASQHPSLQSLPVKQPPEDARKIKELLLFDDIPETKLDRLRLVLHLTPDATESEAQDWAEPLELPESRVLAWFRYQRKSGASQSPTPSKYEEVDELSTPKTLVKHELSPEATGSDLRSNSRGVYSPMGMDMETDEEQQAEMQVSRLGLVGASSEQRLASPARTTSSPPINQLPTPTDSASTSPNPSDAGQTFVRQQQSILSPSSVTNSQAGLSAASGAARPELEDGEILIEGTDELAGPSSPPTVGSTRRDSAHSLGDRTGNSFPVLTPRAPPDVPFASPMQQSPSRGGAHSRHNSWDTNRPSHSRRLSLGESSRQQYLPPPSPYTGYGKGKAREVLEGADEPRQVLRFVEQHSLGPHRDRPRPPRLQTHPYRVQMPSSPSHRDRQPASASISDAMTPSTSRSMASLFTAGSSVSPPPRSADALGIVQAVTMAFKDMPVPSARMDVDSVIDGATSSKQENVRKIQEINSWALGAAKRLGVSLEDFASRGTMPPPPNPLSSPNFRK